MSKKIKKQFLPTTGQKVVVMGLGLHGGGVATAAFFAKSGATVIATDLKSADDLALSLEKLRKFKNIEYVLGRHRASDFSDADLIIRNPAVQNDAPLLQLARKNNIPVHTDISFFLNLLRNLTCLAGRQELEIKNFPVIGITGTKGKSTTAALLHHVLTKCGQQTLLAGNICKSPLNFVKINSKNWKLEIPARQQLELQAIAGGENWKFIILELSSWQLESLGEHRLSPKLALITNILPDHLNRYQNFAAYVQAKKLIYKYQTNKDALFLNSADPRLRQIGASPSIKAKIVWYGASGKDGSLSLIHPNNLSAVKSVCRYLKIPARPMEKAIKSFPGLNGRLEHLGIINGITYINDTCATQPEATIYAIDKLSGKKIILIAGGEDKKLDFTELARTIAKKVKTLVLFKGSASDKILQWLTPSNRDSLKIISNLSAMKTAVQCAQAEAKRGDIILLSPGSASFNLFVHEFDRGDQFKKYINQSA